VLLVGGRKGISSAKVIASNNSIPSALDNLIEAYNHLLPRYRDRLPFPRTGGTTQVLHITPGYGL